jgi:molecular chaperone HscB
MNYFDLFGIPVQLKIPPRTLSKTFFELSRKFHPDYFVKEGAGVQAEALEKSAMLNRAYKVFQNTDDTIKYVLQLKGLLEEEEKYELPPEFLAEVMEINEQLMDRPEVTVTDDLELAIKNLEKEIYGPVRKIVEEYKDDTSTTQELLQVKEYYYKKKYLDRIRRQLAGML